MIGHRIDLNDFLFPVCDDAGDISVEFGFVLFWDERLPRFDGKDDVYVELGVGVCHRSALIIAEYTAPLERLARLAYFYRHTAPMERGKEA